MTNFNKTHPERKSHEVFVSNADDSTYHHVGWNTKRKGQVAYSYDGDELGTKWPGGFPVFVNHGEIASKNPKMLAFLDSDED